MNTTTIPLRSLGGDAHSVTELFHRLNSVLPLDQKVVSVTPDMLAVEALNNSHFACQMYSKSLIIS